MSFPCSPELCSLRPCINTSTHVTNIYWHLANCQKVIDLGGAMVSNVDNICDPSFRMEGMGCPMGGECSRPSVQEATARHRWKLSLAN